MSKTTFDNMSTMSEIVLNRRAFLLGAATLVGGIALTACDTSTPGAGSTSTQGKKYTLVLIKV